MGNEVVMDVYRDEDHGPRVELERLTVESQIFDVVDLVKAVAPEVAIPTDEVALRLQRMSKHIRHPSIFIVLKVQRVIRGLIIAEVGDTANTEHVGWLRMEVHPDYRSKGYGALLLGAMLGAARQQGLKRLEITSYKNNVRAREFFIRHGFQNEGLHRIARRDPVTGEFIDTYTLAAIL